MAGEQNSVVTMDSVLKLQREVEQSRIAVEQADKEVVSSTKRANKKKLEYEGLNAQLEKAKVAFKK